MLDLLLRLHPALAMKLAQATLAAMFAGDLSSALVRLAAGPVLTLFRPRTH